jgi:hypothetical protein
MANTFVVRAQVAIVTAILFGVRGGSTTKTLVTHPMQEFFTCMGGIHIHGNWFCDWGDEQATRKGRLRGSGPSCNSGALPLSVLLCTMLVNSDIKIRSDHDQFVKCVDRMSSMNKLILDAGEEMLIEVVSEIGRRVSGVCH